MKRAIYIILLLLYTTLVHAYMYQSNMPTYQPQTKIGYTTNYSNGQFTPSAYQNFNTSTYSGTYNPYSNGNANNGGSGRPGQARRVKGYTDDGEEHDDGNSDTYNPWIGRTEHFLDNESEYTYYWYGDHWWRKNSSGSWQIWTSWAGWHSSWGVLYPSHPDDTAQKGYNKDKPTPIGDATTPFLLLMFAYLSCQEIKKRR